MIYHKHIDGLRCFAVLAVFLMHLQVPGFSGGFVGVDIFFVISGFLISSLIMNELEKTNDFSFITFYCRRALRICPALFFILLLCFLSSLFLLHQDIFLIFGKSMMTAALAVSNVFFYQHSGYFDIYSQLEPSSTYMVPRSRRTILLSMAISTIRHSSVCSIKKKN